MQETKPKPYALANASISGSNSWSEASMNTAMSPWRPTTTGCPAPVAAK